ncbi:MAG: primary-amine oxidase [Candidatus Competibacterales bacterium]
MNTASVDPKALVEALSPPAHPLDPLTPAELTAAVALLQHTDRLQRPCYITLSPAEPDPRILDAWEGRENLPRRVEAVVLDKGRGCTVEALVCLTAGDVVAWRERSDVQPAIAIDEFGLCEAIAKADPVVQAALARRGITDPELLMVDPWSAGHYGDPLESQHRLSRALVWVRSKAHDNGYAHPVEGLRVLVDLMAERVVAVEDDGDTPVPIPPQDSNYAARFVEPRPGPKPLEITQPEGPSFEVDGHHVSWMNWSLRIGFTPREGLVLHRIGYVDRGRWRSIVQRASLSEMVVPYGDTAPNQIRKNAFDVGEYGIGCAANSLTLGCDCLGLIRYFDAHMINTRGEVETIKNAVCMHEEDYGILWKHTDWRTGEVEVRRSRRLVISSIATVGNYEYGFFWYFYLDGTIQFEIKLTGIVTTGALALGQDTPYGQRLAPGLYAPIHQHIFNVRLDMAVDGPHNTVYQVDSVTEPLGEHNPYANAFRAQAMPIVSEADSGRDMCLETARYWKVCNPNVTNALGEAVGYKLIPGENAFALSHPQSSVRRRAGFIDHHLWVTATDPGERYAAGDYPNQRPPEVVDGLPRYVQAKRPLENTPVTLWYNLNSHHVARPEDWPVMPCGYIGFHLKPVGFFDRNPAIDLPPSRSCGSQLAGCGGG